MSHSEWKSGGKVVLPHQNTIKNDLPSLSFTMEFSI